METKMGFRYKFAYSFYDFASYKEFIVQGLGKSILYIFLVTLIFSTITNIKMIDNFNSAISNVQATFVHNAPNFELKNGLLTVECNEPIYYKHGDLFFVVDTIGKTTSSVLDSHRDGIFINSDSMTLRQEYNTIQSIKFTELSGLDGLIITNKVIENFLAVLKFIFPIALLLFNPLISFIENLMSVFLILGPLSMIISSAMGLKLKYSKACTLSFYAMTLPLLLQSLLDVSGINIPEFIIVFYMLSLVYVGLAIRELKNIDKSNLNFMQ